MTAYTIPDNLPPGVSADFTRACHICGASVRVEASVEQPHRCRIEVS